MILMVSVAAGAEPPLAEFLSLEDLLSAVDTRSPELKSVRAAASAAEGRVGPAGTWPNPSVGFSREKIPGGEKMSHLKGEQEIPFPGKLTQDARMTAHEAQVLQEQSRQKALAIRSRARVLYFDLRRAEEVTRRISDQIAIVDSLMASLRGRVAGGGGGGMGGGPPGADLFALEAERGRMSNMLLMEKQARLTVRFELNALLDQSPEAPLSARGVPVLKDPPGTVEFLIEQARAQGPLFRQAQHEESHARAQLRRSRLSYAPDLAVMYDRSKDDDGMTGYEAGVSASVPLWWSRPQGERREARAHMESAQSSARAMENEVLRAVTTERGEVATRLALARSFETVLLPAARSSLELSRRRFESGSFPFVQFLEALRTLSAAEIDYQDSLVQYAVHWGMLEEWVGVPLDTLPH